MRSPQPGPAARGLGCCKVLLIHGGSEMPQGSGSCPNRSPPPFSRSECQAFPVGCFWGLSLAPIHAPGFHVFLSPAAKKEKVKKKKREDVCGVQIKGSKRNGGWTRKTCSRTLFFIIIIIIITTTTTTIYIYILQYIYMQPFIMSIYIHIRDILFTRLHIVFSVTIVWEA